MRKLGNLKPERVFYYFEELSNIPRESSNEEKVSNYLVETAKKLNLEVYQDKMLNVVIKKPATKGYEDTAGVILQGHMDMVCEKELDSTHDFTKDPIDLVIDGNYIRANKTTLGADNGIAVAMSLALLEDDTIEHPALEFLATVEEETTMGGASGIEAGILKGKYLINVDSEDEGILTAGCAGGIGITACLEGKIERINKEDYLFSRITVKNLFGGHSGIEIDRSRLNANKVANEIFMELIEKFNLKLGKVEGGTKDNAIPRACFIDFAVDKNQKDEFEKISKEIIEKFNKKYVVVEDTTEILIEKIEAIDEVFSFEFFKNYLALINEIPTGVNTWMKEYPDIVESSDNLAIIKTEENKISITTSLRSSEPEILQNLLEKIKKAVEKHQGSYNISGGYPEWRFKKESKLRDTAIKVYNNMFKGEEMKVNVIHAGLECGAISSKYPDLDMISIGPNIYDVHTPKEHMEIKSVEKYYYYLIELLKNLK